LEPIDLPFPPHVFVEVQNGDLEGQLFPVTEKTVTIGRAPGCDLVLPDPYISRKHCQIVFRGDHFTAVDLGSLNKTRVKENTYIQKNLRHDYVLTLGKTRLRFIWEKANEWVREQEAAGLLVRQKDTNGAGTPSQGGAAAPFPGDGPGASPGEAGTPSQG
jgi:pSer/pThr/pTyr-binding forkhead associated (FHA) protein